MSDCREHRDEATDPTKRSHKRREAALPTKLWFSAAAILTLPNLQLLVISVVEWKGFGKVRILQRYMHHLTYIPSSS